MPDPYLTAIVESVENGGDPVEVTLALTAGTVVTGFVRRGQFFVSVSQEQARDLRLARTLVKKRRPETYADADAVAESIKSVFRDVDGPGDDAVTVSDVRVVWSTGDGMSIPTLRVNLDAIAAWWLGRTATPFKGSKDSGAFFGVAVPVDFG